MRTTREILEAAKAAVPALASANAKIDGALLKIADMLCEKEALEAILDANKKDIDRAEGISEVMKDRLRLDEKRIFGMAEGIRGVAKLPSPLGKILEENIRPNGLKVTKISVSMGVVAIIYESRPNVTSDAAALALKSGNVCILRGGKEAYLTSAEIVKVIRKALVSSGLPADAAWRAITINPAVATGIADRVGSLEVGKDGDVVIWTADPITTIGGAAYVTVVDGKVVYEAE